MPITTYAELQTAISDRYDNNTEITANIPEFIELAEATIRRRLRTMGEEIRTDLTCVQDVETVDLPVDFIGLRSAFVVGNPHRSLSQVTPHYFRSVFAGSENGKPKVFMLSSDKMFLAPTPDFEYTVTLDYYGFEALSGSNPSNSILAAHPDLYLYLSLAEAARFMYDEKREMKFMMLAERTIEEAQLDDEMTRFGSTPLMMRVIK